MQGADHNDIGHHKAGSDRREVGGAEQCFKGEEGIRRISRHEGIAQASVFV